MNTCWIKQDDDIQNLAVKKIPRPPNAFMLFANANRKLMAQKHPTESNKDISKRLGSSWKILDLNEKNKYFDRAKAIDNDHKKKYPSTYCETPCQPAYGPCCRGPCGGPC